MRKLSAWKDISAGSSSGGGGGQPMTSALLRAEEGGDRLSEEELLANLIMMFVAGFETTTNLIGNGILTLYRHPGELQRFKEEPGIAANAIEELLRFETPVQYTTRAAAEEVEIGGKRVKAGDWVFAFLAAGNRDPAVFAAPDRLDIGRSNIRPLSFGGGLHFCIGAQLARLEAEIAITTLVRRLPTLRIHDMEHPKWRPLAAFRGLEELHASW
jgi:cytochrome P450